MSTWPLYEVFIRSKNGLQHKHVGSLHAPDASTAIENARDVSKKSSLLIRSKMKSFLSRQKVKFIGIRHFMICRMKWSICRP